KPFHEMTFRGFNWIAVLAWGLGIVAATAIPGIPPINALIGSAVMYVLVSKVVANIKVNKSDTNTEQVSFDVMSKDARLQNTTGLWDISITGETIDSIQKAGEANQTDRETIDVAGALVLPPFIEPHIHLDTTLTAGDPAWNQSGTLFEGIQRWSERKESLTIADVKERSKRAISWQIAQGIQHIRTHVDVTDPKLTAMQALLEVKEEMAP